MRKELLRGQIREGIEPLLGIRDEFESACAKRSGATAFAGILSDHICRVEYRLAEPQPAASGRRLVAEGRIELPTLGL
jgi:hypothetical protein